VVKCDIWVIFQWKLSGKELFVYILTESTIDPLGVLPTYHSFLLVPVFLPTKRQHFPFIFVKWWSYIATDWTSEQYQVKACSSLPLYQVQSVLWCQLGTVNSTKRGVHCFNHYPEYNRSAGGEFQRSLLPPRMSLGTPQKWGKGAVFAEVVNLDRGRLNEGTISSEGLFLSNVPWSTFNPLLALPKESSFLLVSTGGTRQKRHFRLHLDQISVKSNIKRLRQWIVACQGLLFSINVPSTIDPSQRIHHCFARSCRSCSKPPAAKWRYFTQLTNWKPSPALEAIHHGAIYW